MRLVGDVRERHDLHSMRMPDTAIGARIRRLRHRCVRNATDSLCHFS